MHSSRSEERQAFKYEPGQHREINDENNVITYASSMIFLSTGFILMAKFGNGLGKSSEPRYEIPFYRQDLHLLALLLFYRLSSVDLCRGASIIFNENLIFANDTDAGVPGSQEPDVQGAATTMASKNVVELASVTSSAASSVHTTLGSDSVYIIRNHLGDAFFENDHSWLSCSAEKCRRKSSGTASVAVNLHNIGDERKLFFDRFTPDDKLCHCRCHRNTPIFREDLHVCVNDIHECPLVSFISGNVLQKIPYVLLPLRGQIIYPNAEIKFTGLHSVPICVISRVRCLSQSGWVDIRNYSSERSLDSPLPFRLFHDNQRIFLQWLGNMDLRMRMEGRLSLIDLICKDTISQLIFTPCISFRVAGAPGSNGFFSDEISDSNTNFEKQKFSSHEYVALAFATILIALIYIGSVFLYLHFKKSKLNEKSLRHNKAFKLFTDVEDNASYLFSESNASTRGQSEQLIIEQEGLVKSNPLLLKRYHSSSNGNTSHASNLGAEEVHNFDADLTDLYNTVGPKISSFSEHARVTNFITSTQLDTFVSRKSTFRNKLTRNDFSAEPKTQFVDLNSREEKHPDEDISIVECPEDVVPTNSRHKLYFNPAYLEPELLMAPPPAAVEFLSKIREIMSLAKRRISNKKFFPSLTEIPEETKSHGDSTATRKSSSIERASLTSEARSVSEIHCSPYLLKEDKEKRQSIQKWLQTIPTSDSKINNSTPEKLSTFSATEIQNQTTANFDQVNTATIGENASDKKSIRRASLHHSTCEAPFKSEHNSLKSSKSSNSSSRASTLQQPNGKKIPIDSLKRHHICKRNKEKMESSQHKTNTMTTSSKSSACLRLDEEISVQNDVFNIVTGSTTISKLKTMTGQRENVCLKDFCNTEEENRYSLVSEIYVNDEFSSDEESLSLSSYSENIQMKPDEENKKYGESSRLMIQLNDCPFFYIMESTDDFEPDTLDRNRGKEETTETKRNNFHDSLERPSICLRSYGSFRNEFFSTTQQRPSTLQRSFSSLQEIYQQRRQTALANEQYSSDGAHSLTPQIERLIWKRKELPHRHHFRQRKQSSPPPLPNSDTDLSKSVSLPPIKATNFVSLETTSRENTALNLVAPNCRNNQYLFPNRAFKFAFQNKNVWSFRPDDSGYLSTSNSEKSQARSQSRKMETHGKSLRCRDHAPCVMDDNDEDDDDEDSTSCSNDANSESGAESTATNFKFYKNSVKLLRDFDEEK